MGRSKFGFFIHEDSEDANTVHRQLLEMADRGDLGCVEVLNNKGLANDFARRGVLTSIRFTTGVGNGMPPTFGDDRDYHPGKNWFKPEDYWGVDENVYIKPWGVNEQNHLTDGIFWKGIIDRAVEVGKWKICCFCDGVGHPADFREERINGVGTGKYLSEAWDLRVSSGAMRTGKKHGFKLHYNGYGLLIHLFSPNGDYVGSKETDDPGSALWFDAQGNIIHRDDGAWFWYGGRALTIYKVLKPNGLPLIPEDSRMNIVYSEARSSDAIYRGPQEIIDDARGYDIRTVGDPYFDGYCIWQIGRGYIFAYSAADRGVPQIAIARRGVR